MRDAASSSASRQLIATASLLGVPFHDPQAADRFYANTRDKVAPSLISTLPALLAESPDPDSALMLFDRLVSESTPEMVRVLERQPALAHYAIVVFGNSRWLGETLIHNPDLLLSLQREKNLDRSLSREEFQESFARFRSRSFETDISLLLARFKRREYIRIMLRDVLRIAPLAETTAEISALTDVLIDEALRVAESRLRGRFGMPEHITSDGRLEPTTFAVLALGKLGGNELNYSSDVDLMFIYGDGEQPAHARLSNCEYFVRLAQRVTEILCCHTRDGVVFRIDTRLRPRGNEGELAISLSHALSYYARYAQDWERQALIKVRHCAGDPELARSFMQGVQEHVYTTETNFRAVDTALTALQKLRTKRSPRVSVEAEQVNVKYHHGGIRDIEFLVQCLQRVYGGAEPWLRSGGTLFALQKLVDKQHLTSHEFHELTDAYEFLRHLEHRLQLRHGQQVHTLPADPHDFSVIERSMAPYTREGSTPSVLETIRARMESVSGIYRRIVLHQQSRESQEMDFFELSAAVLPGIPRSNREMLSVIAQDAPQLYDAANDSGLGSHARKNLFRFLSAALTSSERYASLLRHAHAISHALPIFEYSDYLTDILIRNPEEIETLDDIGGGRQPRASLSLFEMQPQARRFSDPVFAYLADSPSSYGEKLALLRQHYRHCVFRSGATDIAHGREVYESLAVNTTAAEDAIGAAFHLAGSPGGVAIFALGRLGSREFDLLSDADVLFVCDEYADREELAVVAGQFMQVLSAYTRTGMVFAVDARLRPRGREGELIVSPTQLAAYFERDAQAWEALTYTKLRCIAGDEHVAERTLQARSQLFRRYSATPSFAGATVEMRHKLEKGSERTFKTAPGATYDIDFLTSFLLLKHGIEDQGGTLRDRIWSCCDFRVLTNSNAAALDRAAELFRTAEHATRLVVGRALRWLPTTEHARLATEGLVSRMLGRAFPDGLEQELLSSAESTRSIYRAEMSKYGRA